MEPYHGVQEAPVAARGDHEAVEPQGLPGVLEEAVGAEAEGEELVAVSVHETGKGAVDLGRQSQERLLVPGPPGVGAGDEPLAVGGIAQVPAVVQDHVAQAPVHVHHGPGILEAQHGEVGEPGGVVAHLLRRRGPEVEEPLEVPVQEREAPYAPEEPVVELRQPLVGDHPVRQGRLPSQDGVVRRVFQHEVQYRDAVRFPQLQCRQYPFVLG